MLLISNIALSVIAFYMFIGCNFLKELIGCHLQELLDTNMLAKHLLGFILLIFLIVAINPANADLKIMQIIGISALIYIAFLITTRSHYFFTIATIVFLLIIYVLESAKNRNIKENNPAEVAKINKQQLILALIAIAINLVGFVVYVIEKKKEYKTHFKLFDFIVGTPNCRRHTPHSAKIVKDY